MHSPIRDFLLRDFLFWVTIIICLSASVAVYEEAGFMGVILVLIISSAAYLISLPVREELKERMKVERKQRELEDRLERFRVAKEEEKEHEKLNHEIKEMEKWEKEQGLGE